MEAASPPPPPPAPAADDAEGDVLTRWLMLCQYSKVAMISHKIYCGAVVYPENAKEKEFRVGNCKVLPLRPMAALAGVKILKGVDLSLIREAFRVVSELPSFEKPGIKDGKNVLCGIPYQLTSNFNKSREQN